MTKNATQTDSLKWQWESSYTQLPQVFYTRTRPIAVREPRLVIFNHALATELNLGPLDLEPDAAIFTGNKIPEGTDPIAQAYAGHQFGHFTNLGDGRAILLGEHLDASGKRYDIQLKGAGRTPYSRGGDGRAALGPMLREYLISEAMHALGIPSTRSLAVASTGETVFRQKELPGAILTRIAASHIRVGTFQYAAAHNDLTVLTALADTTLQRHFPECAESDRPYFSFFEAVIDRQAALIAQWQLVGFIHGVMNTDNMALSGETIDYGPCAFMDHYDPDTVFSSIDRHGRYAYSKQPVIARWNLARLAETLLPLFSPDPKTAIDLANAALGNFENCFQQHWLLGMRAKLGLTGEQKDDATLIQDFLRWMKKNHLDFTNTFRELGNEQAITEAQYVDPDFLPWHERWKNRLFQQNIPLDEIVLAMNLRNPAVIPRNHLVEAALHAASEQGDYSVFRRLIAVISNPYQFPVDLRYRLPAPDGAPAYQTFCGT